MKARYAQHSLINTPTRVRDASAINLPVSIAKVRRTLLIWRQRFVRRNELRHHLLWSDARRIENDIGVRPGTLELEARKPFWRK